jgi:hypothetical protein
VLCCPAFGAFLSQGVKTKNAFESLADVDLILFPYGGDALPDLGHHWSAMGALHPFSKDPKQRLLLHADSLATSNLHSTPRLARAMGGLLNHVRDQIGMDEVQYTYLKLNVPQQPTGSNACGLFAATNTIFMADAFGAGRTFKWNGE